MRSFHCSTVQPKIYIQQSAMAKAHVNRGEKAEYSNHADILAYGTFRNRDQSNHMFLRQLLKRKQTSNGMNNENPTEERKKTAIGILIYNMIFIIIDFQFLLFAYGIYHLCKCWNRMTKDSPKNRTYRTLNGDLEEKVFEDFTEFWRAEDLKCEDDILKYSSIVRGYLSEVMNSPFTEKKMKARMEINEITLRNYIKRLAVWQEYLQGNSCMLDLLSMEVMYKATLYGHYDLAMSFLNGTEVSNARCAIAELMANPGIPLLHLCVMNHQLDIISELFNLLPVEDCHSLTHMRSPKFVGEGCLAAAELPLNLAVAIGDESIVKILVDHGAEMCEEDNYGYNVFHALVFLGKTNPTKADDMFDVLVDLIPQWISKTKTFPFLKEMTHNNALHVGAWKLLKSTDKTRLTPIKLAARLGVGNVLQKIINFPGVYRFPYYQIGDRSESMFDISEVDPYLTQSIGTRGRASVLELLVLTSNEEALSVLEKPPISCIVERKTGHYWGASATWALLHIITMTTLTLLLLLNIQDYMQPVLGDQNKSSTNDNSTHGSNSHYQRNPKRFCWNKTDLLLLFLSNTYFLYSMLMIAVSYKIVVRCENGFKIKNVVWILNQIHTFTMLNFTICSSVYFVLKLLKDDNEIIALALAILMGWFITLYFLRSFGKTMFFSIISSKILYDDILNFSLVILLFIFAFTFSTALIFAPLAPPNLAPDFGNILLSYFKLGFGVSDFLMLYSLPGGHLSYFLYIFFIFSVNLVILNLLIASMSDTFANGNTSRHLLAMKAKTCSAIFMEWLLPSFLQSFLAVPTQRYLLRIKLPDGSLWENHVILTLASAPDIDVQ